MVDRANFIQAIRDFKSKHNGKLKNLLNEKSNPEAVKSFWNDPVIQGYLARSDVTFVDKHPQLHDSTTKQEHDSTDHYELKIYKYLPNEIFYRNDDIISPKFYTSGSRDRRNLFFNLMRTFIQDSDDIEIGSPVDLYKIKERISRRFLTAQGTTSPRFLINANWKDTHASTCITILNPETRRQLITLFMNSIQNNIYYSYTKERFFHTQILELGGTKKDFQTSLKNYLENTFSIDVNGPSLSNQPSSLLINKEERAAITINYLDEDYNSEAYKAIGNSTEIENIYELKMDNYKNPPVPKLSMSHTPKTPFIDVSHNLQQYDDDQNCVLYSINFIEAVVKMLKQPDVANRVFELACICKSDPDAQNKLKHMFQEELKAYLPCYYDKAEPKSRAELEIFHLKQRWEIGRKSLSIFHPVEQPVSIEATIDTISHTSENTVIKTSSL